MMRLSLFLAGFVICCLFLIGFSKEEEPAHLSPEKQEKTRVTPHGFAYPPFEPFDDLPVNDPVTVKINRFFVSAAEAGLEEDFVWPVWITILPRGHTLNPLLLSDENISQRWWEIGNTRTDVYIFAPLSPDNPRLILEFVPLSNTQTEARIYLNKGTSGLYGSAPLEYTIEDQVFHVKSTNGFPYMRIFSRHGPWVSDGMTNFNLDMLIDGAYPPGGYPYEHQTTDGIPDWEIHSGTKGTDIPQWHNILIAYDPDPTRAYPRFGGTMRMEDISPPYIIADPFMPTFPHLDLGLGGLQAQKAQSQLLYDRLREMDAGINWFKQNPRPIYYDMSSQQFQFNPISCFQQAGCYYYNSYMNPPVISFESPFAFYNFDSDVTTNPEKRFVQLLVRAEYAPLEDTFAYSTRRQRSSFRYTWKTEDDRKWKYSVNVAGGHRYDESVQIGHIEVLGVRPDTYPNWVMSKEWPLVTFVESISGTEGSEGLYYYTAQAPENRPWVDGQQDQEPLHFEVPDLEPGVGLSTTSRSDVSLVVGYRGEYHSSYFRQPRLYMSPVDKRLHLWHAKGGVWYLEGGEKLGNHRILRMHNLREDPYIDGWTREFVPAQTPPPGLEDSDEWSPKAWHGEIEESLYTFDNYFLYNGPAGSQVRYTEAYTPSLFTIIPPIDSDTWHLLREQLRPFLGHEEDPFDLFSWLENFPGKEIIGSTGAIKNVRATEDMFRFEIELGSWFQVQEPCPQTPLKPGHYIVIFKDGCHIEPWTPPRPYATLLPATLTQLRPGAIQVVVRNTGGSDLPDARIGLQPTTPDGEETRTQYERIDLAAGETITKTFRWPPLEIDLQTLATGNWTFLAHVIDQDGHILSTSDPSVIHVTDTPDGNTFDMIQASLSFTTASIILSILSIKACIAATILWLQWRSSRR